MILETINRALSILCLLALFLLSPREITLILFDIRLNSLKLLFIILIITFVNFLGFTILSLKESNSDFYWLEQSLIMFSFLCLIFYCFFLTFLPGHVIKLPRRFLSFDNFPKTVGGLILYPRLFLTMLIVLSVSCGTAFIRLAWLYFKK